MSIRILEGDCRDVLAGLADESVHCVVTSPPYWGLRDYGTAEWEGGEAGCDHTPRQPRARPELSNPPAGWAERDVSSVYHGNCKKCGARRIDRQLGLEATPDEHVAVMVGVFREVRRVLRSDGTLWLNYGDCYNAYNGGAGPSSALSQTASEQRPQLPTGYGLRTKGLKPKDLVGMPWRIAFALQADGWWLRSDIIWHKPNPMPESVTDRPTSAHEHVFLLSKSARYFYDAEAVREVGTTTEEQANSKWAARRELRGKGQQEGVYHSTKDSIPFGNFSGYRNLRNVWTIATAPFSEAHFATFPPALVEPCIKAGTSERGCCPACGAPWVREIAKSGGTMGKGWHNHEGDAERGQRGGDNGHNAAADAWHTYRIETIGWSPSCVCPPAAPVPATVLDCFGGAGTVGLVADRLQRNAVLIELNPAYAEMARKRLVGDAPLLSAVL